MKVAGTIKQEHILNAAIRRYAHFGINKTTLTEIAEDLAISKTALFYYFNDKNSLTAAVVAKIINESLDDFEVIFKSETDFRKALLLLVDLKRKYFKQYFLLAIQGEAFEILNSSPEISAVYGHGKERLLKLVASLLEQGIDQRILRPMDTRQTAKILLATLSAIELSIKAHKAVPGITEIDEMFDTQEKVLDLFFNGLKSYPCNS